MSCNGFFLTQTLALNFIRQFQKYPQLPSKLLILLSAHGFSISVNVMIVHRYSRNKIARTKKTSPIFAKNCKIFCIFANKFISNDFITIILQKLLFQRNVDIEFFLFNQTLIVYELEKKFFNWQALSIKVKNRVQSFDLKGVFFLVWVLKTYSYWSKLN